MGQAIEGDVPGGAELGVELLGRRLDVPVAAIVGQHELGVDLAGADGLDAEELKVVHAVADGFGGGLQVDLVQVDVGWLPVTDRDQESEGAVKVGRRLSGWESSIEGVDLAVAQPDLKGPSAVISESDSCVPVDGVLVIAERWVEGRRKDNVEGVVELQSAGDLDALAATAGHTEELVGLVEAEHINWQRFIDGFKAPSGHRRVCF